MPMSVARAAGGLGVRRKSRSGPLEKILRKSRSLAKSHYTSAAMLARLRRINAALDEAVEEAAEVDAAVFDTAGQASNWVA